MRGEIFHYTSGTPFFGLCGAQTTVQRNGHNLTSQTILVNCLECKRLRAEEQVKAAEVLRAYQEGQRRRFVASNDLPVSWK